MRISYRPVVCLFSLTLLAGCAASAPEGPAGGAVASQGAQDSADALESAWYFEEGHQLNQQGLCLDVPTYDVIARAAVGERAEVSIVLNNRCAGVDIPLYGFEFIDVDGAFELLSDVPAVIPAGDSVALQVGFEATADIIHLAELRLETGDELARRQHIELYGIVPKGDGYRSGDSPTADAGPDYNTCQTGVSEPLDGSGSSDPEDDSLTYRWSFKTLPGGSSLTEYYSITDYDQVSASFVPDVDGAYMVRLVVNDGTSIGKDFSQWTATTSGSNSAPVADAGGFQGAVLSETVTCDGSGSSDSDGDSLTYEWSFFLLPGGSSLTDDDITGAASSSASFTPDVEGTYALKLRVWDGAVFDKAFAYTVVRTNNAPNSEAGDAQTVSLGTDVSLDASGSTDADGDTLSYTWSFKTKPGGSALTNDSISDRYTSSATFTPDVAGAWRVRLTVNDGYDSDVDFVDITVE
jgi:hypothetical protein